MKKWIGMGGAAMVLMLAGTMLRAAEEPKMPVPEKEHAWLGQLVGEWKAEGEGMAEPGKPPMKPTGTESVRAIGGFWILCEHKMTWMDQTMNGILTLGFDPVKKKYTGTWVDSTSSYIWRYEGTVDEGGKVLTLLTEGPHPAAPEKMAKFREVLEIKDKDNKVFTSSLQEADGKWTTFMTIKSTRK